MSEEPTLWTCDEVAENITCETRDEAIEEYLDYCGMKDGTITVYGYASDVFDRDDIESWMDSECGPLAQMLASLDEDYGSPDEASEPTPAMEEAARHLIATVLREYHVWSCHEVCREEVDVAAWIKEHRPDWLAEES